MPLLLNIVVLALVVGFAVWPIDKLPIEEPYKAIGKGVVLFAVVLYVLPTLLGIPLGLPNWR